ncbi:C-type lectin domain family 4 member E-like [Megalobrama amblycephala]|uniref:C-type lectin domain family 4 member E-like n=1 Tax=Megalobrama amblycephala TaxID=75352 RepID=UPI002013CE0D|nr:C-type lectin domain family 4 member E-like [Megalobrama amblycephala]XP_048016060.1 C-type lectin domain family 4 member E-like [Megalobrama amblycephala]
MAVWTVYLSICLLVALNASVETRHVENKDCGGNALSLDGFFMSPVPMTWSDSRRFCINHGGDLVIIKSVEKQRLVSSLVREKMHVSVWIGLNDLEIEGNMKWVDNTPLNQGFWMSGEPNNNDGNEDCVIMNPIPNLGNWNDIPCLDKSTVLCE